MKIPYKYSIPLAILFIFFMYYEPVVCFIILGGLGVVKGTYAWISISEIQKNGIQQHGKIISYDSDTDGHKTPTIQFYTLEGMEISRQPMFYASTDLSIIRTYKRNINKEIQVLYDPKNPQKFLIKREGNFNYLILSLFIIIGSVFLVTGLLHVLGIIHIKF